MNKVDEQKISQHIIDLVESFCAKNKWDYQTKSSCDLAIPKGLNWKYYIDWQFKEGKLKVTVTYSIYWNLTQPMCESLNKLLNEKNMQYLLNGIEYQLDTDYGLSLMFENYFAYDEMPDIDNQDLINFDAIKKKINMVKKELNKLVLCNRMKLKMKI